MEDGGWRRLGLRIWRLEDAGCRMEDGGWRMESGVTSLESGPWVDKRSDGIPESVE